MQCPFDNAVQRSGMCEREDCAVWHESAGMCSIKVAMVAVPVISGILENCLGDLVELLKGLRAGVWILKPE